MIASLNYNRDQVERTLRCVQFDFIYYFSSASSHLLYFELFCLLLSCSFLLSADRDDDDEEEKNARIGPNRPNNIYALWAFCHAQLGTA